MGPDSGVERLWRSPLASGDTVNENRFEDAELALWKVTQTLTPDGPIALSAPQWYCPNCVLWLTSPKQARDHIKADAEEAAAS